MSELPWWVAMIVGLAGGVIVIAGWHTIQMHWARGHPIGGEKRFKARSHRPETPEERIDKASQMVAPHWSRKTIKRGMSELKGFYQQEGGQVPSEKELRREAELLLNASVNGESTIE